LLSGDREAYTYLPASVSTFPDADLMCEKLTEAGLRKVRATSLTGGVASLYEGIVPVSRERTSDEEE